MRTLVHIFVALAAYVASPTRAQEVYRCGNTYSHEPCKGARVVDTAPAITDPQGAKTKLIYLCNRPDKSELWWIHEECSRRSWTVVDSVRVPAEISWDEQVEVAKQKRAGKMTRPVIAPNFSNSNSNSNSNNDNSARCQWLDRRVKELDNMGRAGSRYYNLEYVRSERQSARDEQFSLRC